MPHRSRRRGAAESRSLPLLSGLLVVMVAFWITMDVRSRYTPRGRRVRAFEDALRRIERDYATKVDMERVYESAMYGMMASLPDGHSAFLRREESDETDIEIEGEFGGIGVEITPLPGGAVVSKVNEGGPAQKAGVQRLDMIVAVDGKPCDGLRLGQVAAQVRGEIGTTVDVTVRRADSDEERTLTIERARIVVKKVDFREVEPGLAYVRVQQFNKHAAADVQKALTELAAQNEIRGLIIDLRGNRGGLLDQAIALCDMFLADGLIAFTRGRHAREQQLFPATPRTAIDPDVPMVLIVDHESASASEVVAASLKHRARATLVGTRTFGKGAVNRSYRLPDGSAIMLTVAHYAVDPNADDLIEGNGVEPNVVWGLRRRPCECMRPIKEWVEQLDDMRGRQFRRAIRVLKAKIAGTHVDPPKPEPTGDKQPPSPAKTDE